MDSPNDDLVLHAHEERIQSLAGRLAEEKQVAVEDGKYVVRCGGEMQENKVFLGVKGEPPVAQVGNQASLFTSIKKTKKMALPLWVLLALICLIIVAVAVPLAVTRMKKAESGSLSTSAPLTSGSSSTISDGVTAPATASMNGSAAVTPTSEPSRPDSEHVVHKGSRLALLGDEQVNEVIQFYQTEDRSIRFMESQDGAWLVSTDNRIPIEDAKLGSPLTVSSVQHQNGSWIYYLFYVDSNNKIKGIQSIGSTIEGWAPNDIGTQNYQVNEAPSIAFFAKSNNITSPEDMNTSFRLIAAKQDTSLREYSQTNVGWVELNTSFSPANGLGGARLEVLDNCWFLYSSLPEDSFQIRYLDPLDPDKEHHKWTNGASGPGAHTTLENTAICVFWPVVYYQDPTGAIRGVENTASQPTNIQWQTQSFLVSEPGEHVLNGTALSCGTTRDKDFHTYFVLYQTMSGVIRQARYGWTDARDFSNRTGWEHTDIL